MPSLERVRQQLHLNSAYMQEVSQSDRSFIRNVAHSADRKWMTENLGSFLPRTRLIHLTNSLVEAAEEVATDGEHAYNAREAISAGLLFAANIFTRGRRGRSFDGMPITEGFLGRAAHIVAEGKVFDSSTIDEEVPRLLHEHTEYKKAEETADIRPLLVAATGDQSIPATYDEFSRQVIRDGLRVDSWGLLFPIFEKKATLITHLSDAIARYKLAEQDVYLGLLSSKEAKKMKVRAFQEVTLALLHDNRFTNRNADINDAYMQLVEGVLGQKDFPEEYVLLKDNVLTEQAKGISKQLPFNVVDIGSYLHGFHSVLEMIRRQVSGGSPRSRKGKLIPFHQRES